MARKRKKLGTSAKRQAKARRVARAASKPTPIDIRYIKTKGGMIRFQAAEHTPSRPYASRQGARRAAVKKFKVVRVRMRNGGIA